MRSTHRGVSQPPQVMSDSMVTALWLYDSGKVAGTTLFGYRSSNINTYSSTCW